MSTLGTARAHLRGARFSASELSGALGDLGTFLPLLVALTQRGGLDFGTTLFFGGLAAVWTGLAFGVPMAVQPMKAIAAVALAEGLGAHEIALAGAMVGAVVLLLGVTGAIDVVARYVPRAVVRGIQLSLALSLMGQGAALIARTGGFAQLDGWGLALAAAAVVLLGARPGSRLPAALLLFALGLGLTALTAPDAWRALTFAPALPQFDWPSTADAPNALRAAIPQLPLTLLNSVVAVCALTQELYPDRAAPPRSVAVSVGLMNLVSAPFSGMPLCHGAGGLAAQHRFGARTGGSLLALGGAQMGLALLFGPTLLELARAFPQSLLGVLLLFAGLELGRLALAEMNTRDRRDVSTLLVVTGVSVGFGHAALGTGVGLIAYLGYPWLTKTR